jgi:hypothetical protein
MFECGGERTYPKVLNKCWRAGSILETRFWNKSLKFFHFNYYKDCRPSTITDLPTKMLSSARYFHPEQEKTLPLRPLRSTRIELENSHSREALVLENSKLKEEVAEMRTEIDILYTQVAQQSEVLAKYKEYEKEASKGFKRIYRAVRNSMSWHEDAKTEVEQAQMDAQNHWNEFVRKKRSSGVSVDKVIDEMKNRAASNRSSDIDIGINVNMI